jgi:hypothetical protein
MACPAPEIHSVVLRLGPVPSEADSQGETAAGEMVEGGDLLGQDDRIVLGDQKDPGPEGDPLGGRHGSRKGDEGAESPAIVLDPHTFDEGRRHVGPEREMRVLGEIERVEAALLGGAGERARGHVAISEECGYAEPHEAQAAPFGSVMRPKADTLHKVRSGRATSP